MGNASYQNEWYAEQLAERDARLAELESRLKTARSAWLAFICSSYEHKGEHWHALNDALSKEE